MLRIYARQKADVSEERERVTSRQEGLIGQFLRVCAEFTVDTNQNENVQSWTDSYFKSSKRFRL